jgi:copper oxidase (laccase) domain-containing protein
MDRPLETLEFDLGQKWAKGLRIRFHSQEESSALNFEDGEKLKQIHSKKIVDWNLSQSRAGFESLEADGFIAKGSSFKESKRKLYIKTADCAPLFYIDRENECAAALHAGWRGLVQGIHLLPFQRGFNPQTTWVWCGPCLNGTSFEVGPDMWSQFSIKDQNEFFAEQIGTIKASEGKKFFNSWAMIEKSLKNLRIELFYNVEVDTFTNTHYASYRRWKKAGSSGTLQHNYSWISFI